MPVSNMFVLIIVMFLRKSVVFVLNIRGGTMHVAFCCSRASKSPFVASTYMANTSPPSLVGHAA